MKGIFWNSRGLKDLAKRRFLAEASLEHRLDFIALSKLVEIIFLPSFSVLYQEVSILIGTAFLREEDRVGSYLELDVNRWKCEV